MVSLKRIILFTMSPSIGHHRYYNAPADHLLHVYSHVSKQAREADFYPFQWYHLKQCCVLTSYHCLHIHIAPPGPVASLKPPASPELQMDSWRPAGTTQTKSSKSCLSTMYDNFWTVWMGISLNARWVVSPSGKLWANLSSGCSSGFLCPLFYNV